MDEFLKWIKPNERTYEHFLTDELKTRAFKMTLEKRMCQNTTNIIVKIFNCNTCLDIMEELIRESIKQKKFKEVGSLLMGNNLFFIVRIQKLVVPYHFILQACHAVMSLNIQDRFGVEDFLLPLFFINMVSVTEEYLSSSKCQQQALVKYFDNLLLESDDCLHLLAK